MATIKKNGFAVEVESVRKLIQLNNEDSSKLPGWVIKAKEDKHIYFDPEHLFMVYTTLPMNVIKYSLNSTSVLVKQNNKVDVLSSAELSELFEGEVA